MRVELQPTDRIIIVKSIAAHSDPPNSIFPTDKCDTIFNYKKFAFLVESSNGSRDFRFVFDPCYCMICTNSE